MYRQAHHVIGHRSKGPAITAFIITCEHGGNTIPPAHGALFRGEQALLDSHRGFDPGALLMAQDLSAAFKAPLVASTVSRLLVDLNRSIGHPRLFSPMTRRLSPALRQEILAQYYRPYRQQVEDLVTQAVAHGRRVIHVSSHSFTPELDGRVRSADVGLLYDPARPGEVDLCARWKSALAGLAPALRVRRNYPYAGRGDGLTAYLRRRFTPASYIGIELEINHAIALAQAATWPPWATLRGQLLASLRSACAIPGPQ